MGWSVEILDERVERLAAMQQPHVKHLEGKLWEMRMKGKNGIARAIYVRALEVARLRAKEVV